MKGQRQFTLFGILASFIVLFSSCGGGASGGAIFSAIEDEVKLGKKTAPWATRSLVCYNNNLYCTNGNKIFTKGLYSGRGWSEMSTTYDGGIGLLAADDNNLYVLTFSPSTEVTSTNQYSYNYSDAKVNILLGSTGGVVSGLNNVMTIFDNKSYTGGREAFATTADGTTYKLNGTAAPTSTGHSDIASAVKVNGSTQLYQTFISTSDYTNSRAWFVPLGGNGSSFPQTVNETTSLNKAQLVIQGSNNFDLTKCNIALSEEKHGKITGLAYHEEPDSSGIIKQYLLISTTKGYYRLSLDGTNIIKENPHPNGEQLAGQGIIEGSFWTTPNGAIYAGVTAADKNRYGLWAYYPDDTWNLD